MKQWTESEKEMLFLDFDKSLPAWWHSATVVDRHPAWISLVHIHLFPAINLIWPENSGVDSGRGTQPLFLEWVWSNSCQCTCTILYHHVSCGSFITFPAHFTNFYYACMITNKRTYTPTKHTDRQTDRQTDGRTNKHHSMDSPPRRWEWRWKWTIFLHLNGNSKKLSEDPEVQQCLLAKALALSKMENLPVRELKRELRTLDEIQILTLLVSTIWEWENPWKWHNTASFMWQHHHFQAMRSRPLFLSSCTKAIFHKNGSAPHADTFFGARFVHWLSTSPETSGAPRKCW